jgi:uncharacterized protein
MRNLTVTICLSIAVFLGSAGVSWSAEPVEGYCLTGTTLSHSPIAGKCSDAYESGDYATALREWIPLAEQGNADAQHNLGWMYEEGLGVPQDHKTAVKWYTLAAEQGDARAQYDLGWRYGHGLGVPQDNVYAQMWWNISASNGNKDAVRSRDIVAKTMTPSQLEKSQDLARECIAKNYKGC